MVGPSWSETRGIRDLTRSRCWNPDPEFSSVPRSRDSAVEVWHNVENCRLLIVDCVELESEERPYLSVSLGSGCEFPHHTVPLLPLGLLHDSLV